MSFSIFKLAVYQFPVYNSIIVKIRIYNSNINWQLFLTASWEQTEVFIFSVWTFPGLYLDTKVVLIKSNFVDKRYSHILKKKAMSRKTHLYLHFLPTSLRSAQQLDEKSSKYQKAQKEQRSLMSGRLCFKLVGSL